MSWQGSLSLDYRLSDGRTVVHDRHDGPLRVLKSLHPEDPRICHSALVHPPGGIVAGDRDRPRARRACPRHDAWSDPLLSQRRRDRVAIDYRKGAR